MRLLHLPALVAIALFAASLTAPRADAQGSTVDFIRGKITGTDKKGIEGVIVTVTSLALQNNRQTKTAKNGTFQLQFPDGQGDYWIGLAAVGYNPKRFELKRNADEEVLIADASMTLTVNTLTAVHSIANRPRPPANDNSLGSAAAGDLTTVDLSMVQLDQMGDLSAIASMLPGITYIPGDDGSAATFSVLGLDPSQNNYLVNGADNNGSLSADAPVSISVASSVYDPYLGRFSGASVMANLLGGGNMAVRRGRFTVDAPPLQFTDAVGRQEGLPYTNVTAGGNFSGPLALDRAFYNISYTAAHQYSNLQDLFNTDPAALEAAGISQDSVARLLGLLSIAGLSPTAAGVPSDKVMNTGNLTGVFDLNPSARNGLNAFKLSLVGNWRDNQGLGLSTAALPSRGRDQTNLQGSVSLRHSALLSFIASETNIAVSGNRSTATQYAEEPSGTVRVSSTFSDLATPAIASLGFGGGSGNTRSTTTRGNASNLLRWFSVDSKHLIKFANAIYLDDESSSSFPNEFGTFTFNSLSDVQAGQPAQFTRNLTPAIQDLSQGAFGSSLGDSWRPTPDIQVVYGARVDGNHFNERPAENGAVEQTFGLRNDFVPDRLYVSPRLGFSWTYGTAPTIGAYAGSARTPRAVVSGGVGLFQNMGQASQIASAVNTTGLPGSATQLDCVGAAVPLPDWTAYDTSIDSIPSQCANGSAGTVFGTTTPNVTLFDPSYMQPRTVRATLNWRGPILWNHLMANVGTTYSLAQHQSSFVDLNFDPAEQFTIADEGNRPVYVNATSIFPATGVIAAGDGRVTAAFNQVRELKSDAENRDKRLILQLSPIAYNYAFSWSLAYTYEDVRDRQRGFNNSTAANPLDFQWGQASGNSHHVFTLFPSYKIANTVTLSTGLSLRSPTAYTPLVGNDINGDGYLDDRAFIFNPANATDPTLQAGMQSLLGSTSSQARTCLTSQLGVIAGRNSCFGPWSFATQSITLSLNPQKIRLTQRATVQMTISNPAAAADMLLHGVDNQRGWGQNPAPQSTLLYVRGFDPSTNSYLYTVNPRFGATSLALSTLRSPVRLSLYFRYNIGEPNEEQQLMRQLDRGRTEGGVKAAAATIKGTAANPIYNPMSAILQNADSLHLTTAQADSIATLDRYFTAHADSIWTPIAGHLADLPDQYDHKAAYARYLSGREQVIDLLIAISPKINLILTGDQMRRLPPIAAQWLDPRYLRLVRSSTIAP